MSLRKKSETHIHKTLSSLDVSWNIPSYSKFPFRCIFTIIQYIFRNTPCQFYMIILLKNNVCIKRISEHFYKQETVTLKVTSPPAPLPQQAVWAPAEASGERRPAMLRTFWSTWPGINEIKGWLGLHMGCCIYTAKYGPLHFLQQNRNHYISYSKIETTTFLQKNRDHYISYSKIETTTLPTAK